MRIFVSYRSLDRNLVNTLVNDLLDMGHTVWYDQELEGGQQWWEGILENIRRCDVLIFALTPASLESYPCQLEYTYANALKKPIFPVKLVDHVQYDLIPVVLQTRQIIDYSQRTVDSFKKLLSALQNLPPAPALSEPLPTPPPAPISPLAAVRSKIDSPVLTFEQQTAILHQLKSYLHDPEHSGSARELLNRLSEHPTLLASVLREIQALLTAPPPPPAVGRAVAPPPAAVSVEEKPAVVEPPKIPFGLRDGETLLKHTVADVLTSTIDGLKINGPYTIRVPWLENPRLYVTNQRMVFVSKFLPPDLFEIPLSEVADIKKRLWQLMTPVIRLETRSKGACEFAIFTVYPGYGNREELIALVQQTIAERTKR